MKKVLLNLRITTVGSLALIIGVVFTTLYVKVLWTAVKLVWNIW